MAKNPVVNPQSADYRGTEIDLSKRAQSGRRVTLTDPAPYGYDMPVETKSDMPLHDPKVASMPISFEANERGTGR